MGRGAGLNSRRWLTLVGWGVSAATLTALVSSWPQASNQSAGGKAVRSVAVRVAQSPGARPQTVLPVRGLPAVAPKNQAANAAPVPSLPASSALVERADVVAGELLDLKQPALVAGPSPDGPALASSSVAASLGQEEGGGPPRAPEDLFVSQYTDAPYGSVVVIAVKLNDRNEVADARIMIPSKNTMGDLGLLFAAKATVYPKLDPPLRPGEFRWAEFRMTYPSSNDSILP